MCKAYVNLNLIQTWPDWCSIGLGICVSGLPGVWKSAPIDVMNKVMFVQKAVPWSCAIAGARCLSVFFLSSEVIVEEFFLSGKIIS